MCLLSSVVERWSRILSIEKTSKVEGEDNQRPRVQSSQGAMIHPVFIKLLYCNIFDLYLSFLYSVLIRYDAIELSLNVI